MIFDGGVLRTTYVGLLRAFTVFLFFGNLFVVVPKLYLYQPPGQPFWLVPAVAVFGAIPMAYVLWASAPYVATAHLTNIPGNARRSTDHFLRWAKKLPYDSEIEFKMFKWNGLFRRTTVPISELRTKKPRLGIENLVRLYGPEKQPKLFYVGKERRENLRTRLWQTIRSQMDSVEASKKP